MSDGKKVIKVKEIIEKICPDEFDDTTLASLLNRLTKIHSKVSRRGFGKGKIKVYRDEIWEEYSEAMVPYIIFYIERDENKKEKKKRLEIEEKKARFEETLERQKLEYLKKKYEG